MSSPEINPNTYRFSNPQDYFQFLRLRDIYPFNSHAKGILYTDGTIDVVIDTSYYLNGGLESEWLEAIVVHELTELASDDPNPHLEAILAEYKYLLDFFGSQTLETYHRRLQLLLPEDSHNRNPVFSLVSATP